MELAQGDLLTLKKTHDDEMAKKLTFQVLKALDTIHNAQDGNAMHRDIKNQNILYFEEQNEIIFKLGDTGHSKVRIEENDLHTVQIGTSVFKAPELIKNASEKKALYTSKCDIWSLGLTVYQFVEGWHRFPWAEHLPEDERKKMLAQKKTIWEFYKEDKNLFKYGCGQMLKFTKIKDEALKDLLKRMIEPDPEKRISSKDAIGHAVFQNLRSSHQEVKSKTFQSENQRESKFSVLVQSKKNDLKQLKQLYKDMIKIYKDLISPKSFLSQK